MVLISRDAEDGDPVAIGLRKQLTSYKYLALLHLAGDVLSSMNHLSRLFQFRDVSFGALHSTVIIVFLSFITAHFNLTVECFV